MPKVPRYTLAWSTARAAYELYQTHNREGLEMVPESQAWFAWLDHVSSFAFSGKSGHFTARKEARQRGDRYWYAYLTTGRHLSKRYLGKSADLKLVRLEQIAGELSATPTVSRQLTQAEPVQPPQSETQVSTPMVLSITGAEHEAETVQPPLLAGQHPAMSMPGGSSLPLGTVNLLPAVEPPA